MTEHQTISITSIATTKKNVRKTYDDKSVEELAASIVNVGLLQPLLVRPINGDNQYELVCGHRRLRAIAKLGWTHVPVIVREMDDDRVLEAMVIENLQREDVHPLDEAEGYRILMKREGQDVRAVAAKVGKSTSYVYDRVKLLALTKEAQKLFREEAFTLGHAIILARLSPEDQTRCIARDDRGFNRVSGLFQADRIHVNDGDEALAWKPISTRELQAWVDQNVRFDRLDADPMLFPETVKAIEQTATSAGKTVEEVALSPKYVAAITRENYVPPEAKVEGERIIGPRSWKRADGEAGSKTCEHAQLGVIVVGWGRGEAFKVCTAKDKCKLHWGKEIKAKAAEKKAETDLTPKERKAKEKRDKEQAEYDARMKREQEQRETFVRATPALLEDLAAKIGKADVNTTLATVILKRLASHFVEDKKGATKVPRGEDLSSLVQHIAWVLLADILRDTWRAQREFPPIAKALGIDLKKHLKAAAAAKEQA